MTAASPFTPPVATLSGAPNRLARTPWPAGWLQAGAPCAELAVCRAILAERGPSSFGLPLRRAWPWRPTLSGASRIARRAARGGRTRWRARPASKPDNRA